MTAHPRTSASRCGRCGIAYSPSAFDALRPVRVLKHEELAGIVVDWPRAVVIVVRACSSCTTPIARLGSP